MTAQPSPESPEDFLPLAPADFQLLLVLLKEDLHAYGITRAVEEQAVGKVPLEIGSLYRMLARLETWGLIEEDPTPGTGSSGPPRKVFRITAFGVRVADAETARLREVLSVAEARLAAGTI